MNEYWPSDEQISKKIRYALFKDRLIDASDIKINVQMGTVILEGKIATKELKKFAQNAIEDILGVRMVINRLSLKPDYGLIGGHLEWPQ
jgi:osmotically-inducible protein OsmY